MRSSTKANCVELVMLARCILTIMGISAAIPAAAAELRPEEAKYFIAGKYFSYRCFDGTTGGGRINANGSVVGTIQPGGSGPTRVIALPVGTVRVQSDSICASLPGGRSSPASQSRRQIPGAFGARLPGSVSPTVISSRRTRAWNRRRGGRSRPT